MTKWEYKTIKIDASAKSLFGNKGLNMDQQLNELGADGWELVNLVGTASGGGLSAGAQAVFKRSVNV